MANRSPIMLMLSVLLLASLACGLSDITGATSPQQQPGELETAVARSLAETALIQTAIQQSVAGTLDPGQQGIPQNSTQSLPELPILTPSLELTPSSEKPMVSVSQVTNCRSGPGSSYDFLGALNVGEQVEVFGRDPSNTSWYIRNPDNSSGFCWIYGAFATITGNAGTLPVFTPMPTPTPANTATPPIDFKIIYIGFDDCGVGQNYVKFDITNNGSIIWQSRQSIVTDTVTAETVTLSEDFFEELTGCVGNSFQLDLSPGESGGARSNFLAASPAGHLMSASMKLCSLNSLGGTCLTKTLTFTP